MGFITIKEYAERHGKDRSTALKRAQRGCFRTAKKIGCQMFIDEDEPWIDGRIKSGKYIDAREKAEKRKE